MTTLQERAAQLDKYLVINTKEGERQGIIVKADDAPEWVRDVVYTVHGDSFPDDWTYKAIKEAASAIAEEGEEANIEADMYNRDLLDWASNYPDANDCCQEAIAEYGYQPKDMIGLLQAGQGVAYSRVIVAAVAALNDVEEEEEEDRAVSDLFVCARCGEEGDIEDSFRINGDLVCVDCASEYERNLYPQDFTTA